MRRTLSLLIFGLLAGCAEGVHEPGEAGRAAARAICMERWQTLRIEHNEAHYLARKGDAAGLERLEPIVAGSCDRFLNGGVPLGAGGCGSCQAYATEDFKRFVTPVCLALIGKYRATLPVIDPNSC